MREVVGFVFFDYYSKKKNCQVYACRLYVTYTDTAVTGLQGKIAEEIFMTREKLGNYQPQIGDIIDVRYNKYGSIDTIVA